MALNDVEKNDVMFRLGWDLKVLIPTSTSFSNIIVDRLNNLSVPMENIVRGLLKRLKAIQDQMDDARCRITATKVDNITLNMNELDMLKKEFKRYVRELSDTVCIPIFRKGGVNIGVSN